MGEVRFLDRACPAFGRLNELVDVGSQARELGVGPSRELIALRAEVDGDVLEEDGRTSGKDEHALGELDRLVDVVGHEHHGDPQSLPQ